jgi:hypothetical protein
MQTFQFCASCGERIKVPDDTPELVSRTGTWLCDDCFRNTMELSMPQIVSSEPKKE